MGINGRGQGAQGRTGEMQTGIMGSHGGTKGMCAESQGTKAQTRSSWNPAKSWRKTDRSCSDSRKSRGAKLGVWEHKRRNRPCKRLPASKRRKDADEG